MKQTSSLCHPRNFMMYKLCLGVFFLVYDNTALSNSLYLLVDGGLFLWALPIQFIRSKQFILLSLLLFAQSVTSQIAWGQSSIPVSRAASSLRADSWHTLHLSIHLGCYAGSVFLGTLAVG